MKRAFLIVNKKKESLPNKVGASLNKFPLKTIGKSMWIQFRKNDNWCALSACPKRAFSRKRNFQFQNFTFYSRKFFASLFVQWQEKPSLFLQFSVISFLSQRRLSSKSSEKKAKFPSRQLGIPVFTVSNRLQEIFPSISCTYALSRSIRVQLRLLCVSDWIT